MSGQGPYVPPFAQAIALGRLNAFINTQGVRLGWMRGHACPCTLSTDAPGSPDPGCQTCRGRGTYWDSPIPFTGLVTYMHTSAAPDEPGSSLDNIVGGTDRAEPTLTIPATAGNVWLYSGDFDSFVEYDATTRRQSTLEVGGSTSLPYPLNASLIAVTSYDSDTKTVVPVTPLGTGTQGYTYSNGSVTLTGYDPGTPYVVEYTSSPVYVAFRGSGGLAHRRPFGAGAQLPVRFHLTDMDLWIRQRFGGDGPQG